MNFIVCGELFRKWENSHNCFTLANKFGKAKRWCKTVLNRVKVGLAFGLDEVSIGTNCYNTHGVTTVLHSPKLTCVSHLCKLIAQFATLFMKRARQARMFACQAGNSCWNWFVFALSLVYCTRMMVDFENMWLGQVLMRLRAPVTCSAWLKFLVWNVTRVVRERNVSFDRNA